MSSATSLPITVKCCLAFATALLVLALSLLANSLSQLATPDLLFGLLLICVSCAVLLACWLGWLYLRWSQQQPAATSSWFWLN